MPWFDMPLDQLREYRTQTAEPPDLDPWWRQRLDEARAAASPPTLTRYEADIYAPVEVYDAEFSGAGRRSCPGLVPAAARRIQGGADGRKVHRLRRRARPARRARAAARPRVRRVRLMDTICPPSTVFAAYNEITAVKDIAVHPFTGHVVPTAHVERQLRHLRDYLP